MKNTSEKVGLAIDHALQGLQERPRFSFAECVKKFREAGLEFELRPAVEQYCPLPQGARDMVFEKEKKVVHHFDYCEVMCEVRGGPDPTGGFALGLTPVRVRVQTGSWGTYLSSSDNGGKELGERLEAIMIKSVSPVSLHLGEDVVFLPVPGWAASPITEPLISLLLFRSEAEQMWEEFIAQKPFAK